MIKWSIPIIILFMGTSRYLGGDLCQMMSNSMLIGIVGFAGVVVWQINPFISLLYAVSVASAFYPVFNVESYKAVFLTLFYGMSLYCMVYHLTLRYGKEPFLWGVRLLLISNLVLMVFQFYGKDPFFLHSSAEVFSEGFNGGRNLNAFFLLFCIPAFMYRRWLVVIPFIIAGIVLQRTSGPIVWGLIAFGYYLVMCGVSWRVWAVAVPAVTLAGTLFFLLCDTPGMERWGIWGKVFAFHLEQPEGYGTGQWLLFASTHKILESGRVCIYVYNEYLGALFEMGVKAVPAIVCYVGYLLLKLNKMKVQTATAVIMVLTGCLSQSIFHEAPTAIFALMWLAFAEVDIKKRNQYAIA